MSGPNNTHIIQLTNHQNIIQVSKLSLPYASLSHGFATLFIINTLQRCWLYVFLYGGSCIHVAVSLSLYHFIIFFSSSFTSLPILFKFFLFMYLYQARQLVGATFLVKSIDRPELEEGEYYSRDLVGMKIIHKVWVSDAFLIWLFEKMYFLHSFLLLSFDFCHY